MELGLKSHNAGLRRIPSGDLDLPEGVRAGIDRNDAYIGILSRRDRLVDRGRNSDLYSMGSSPPAAAPSLDRPDEPAVATPRRR
jgi:hypothetical protein